MRTNSYLIVLIHLTFIFSPTHTLYKIKKTASSVTRTCCLLRYIMKDYSFNFVTYALISLIPSNVLQRTSGAMIVIIRFSRFATALKYCVFA